MLASTSPFAAISSIRFGLRVAHVDDDNNTRELVRAILYSPKLVKLPPGDTLELTSYDSVPALKEGVQEDINQGKRPDLIISDGEISPGGTVHDVVEFADGLEPPVPVVIYTGDPGQYRDLNAKRSEIEIFEKASSGLRDPIEEMKRLGNWVSEFAKTYRNGDK